MEHQIVQKLSQVQQQRMEAIQELLAAKDPEEYRLSSASSRRKTRVKPVQYSAASQAMERKRSSWIVLARKTRPGRISDL